MFTRTVSAIMLTLILTCMLPLAFHIQPGETELSPLTVQEESAAMQAPINLASQEPPPTEWNKTYGGINFDFAHALVKTNDGRYAIAGYTHSFGAGLFDFWLVRTDSSGNQLWSKTYGGTGSEQVSAHILVEMLHMMPLYPVLDCYAANRRAFRKTFMQIAP